MANLRP